MGFTSRASYACGTYARAKPNTRLLTALPERGPIRTARERMAEEVVTMDGQRFDAWTRALGRELPRRIALKASAGLALAGTAIYSARHEAAPFCAKEDESCGMGCCEDLVCDEGFCVVVGSRACPSLDQSNQCTNQLPECEGNGCKKNHGKKRNKKKHRR